MAQIDNASTSEAPESDVSPSHIFPTMSPSFLSQHAKFLEIPYIMTEVRSKSRSRAFTAPGNQVNDRTLRQRHQNLDLKPQEFSGSHYSIQSSHDFDPAAGDRNSNIARRRPRNYPDPIEHFKHSNPSCSIGGSLSKVDSPTPSPSESSQQPDTPSSGGSSKVIDESLTITRGDPAPELAAETCDTSAIVDSPEDISDKIRSESRIRLQSFMSEDYDFQESEDDESEEYMEAYVDEFWTSDIGDFEAKVLRVAGHKPELAARIIPQLHKMLHEERSPAVGSWKKIVTQCVGHANGSAGQGPASQNYLGHGTSKGGKKRQGLHRKSADGSGEEEDADGEEGSGGRNPKRSKGANNPGQLFACPLAKMYPTKYDAFSTPNYRTCHSPGFADIRRLKEHFERVHRHVQCGRCPEIFTGKSEERLLASETHRLHAGCDSNPPEVNEGITEIQWKLMKGNGGMKGGPGERGRTDVEKWEDIWRILFPNVPLPAPWCVRTVPGGLSSSALEQHTAEFTECYDSVLHINHDQRQIPQEGTLEEVLGNYLPLFKQISTEAFSLWYTKRCVEQEAAEQAVEGFDKSHLKSTATASAIFENFSMRPAASHPTPRKSGGPSLTLRSVSSPQLPSNQSASDHSSSASIPKSDDSRGRSVSTSAIQGFPTHQDFLSHQDFPSHQDFHSHQGFLASVNDFVPEFSVHSYQQDQYSSQTNFNSARTYGTVEQMEPVTQHDYGQEEYATSKKSFVEEDPTFDDFNDTSFSRNTGDLPLPAQSTHDPYQQGPTENAFPQVPTTKSDSNVYLQQSQPQSSSYFLPSAQFHPAPIEFPPQLQPQAIYKGPENQRQRMEAGSNFPKTTSNNSGWNEPD